MSASVRHFASSLALVTALVLAACGGSAVPGRGAEGQTGGSATETLLIGAALPLTGDLAREGKQQKDGYDLWAETVNAKGGIPAGGKRYRVEMRYYDYKSDNTQAVKLVEKLITEDHAQFIFGPYGSGATLAASAVTDKYEVPMLSPSASSESVFQQGRRYLFGLLAPNALVGQASIDLLSTLPAPPQTVAIISRNDLFPKAVAQSIEAAARARGMEIVSFEEYPIGASDLSTPLLTAKARNPDVLVGTGYTNDLVLMTRQMKELRFNPKATVQTTGPTYASYTEALGADANYVISPTWWAPGLPYTDSGKLFGSAADYARLFQDKYKYEVDYAAAAAAGCGAVLQAAIEAAGTIDPVRVRDALATLEVNTFYGPIKFNEVGQNTGTGITIIQIQNGQQVPVAPPEAATGRLMYPMPEWDRR
ncbi:MAG: amino acid ABC transporter substrate-binding protein [Chloroflexi bacterium]|nr:amino acid ABC transporter substrate-binding protein [Chloroflexota bacterium]